MQIRPLFHNTDFLRKNTPKADSRIVLKAARRLVCVLLMLVACVSAVWGTSYRWGNPSVNANWNDPSISNGPWEGENASYVYVGTNNYPGGSSNDIAYMTGGGGSDYIVTLSSDYTFKALHINSDKAGPFKITFRSDSTTKRTITVETLKFVFKQDGTVSDQIELVLDNVELKATNLYINDTVDSNQAWGGTFKVSQPAGSNSAITVTDMIDIRTKDNVQTVIDFGTVPVTAASIAVNKGESYGAEVTIRTDASVTCGWLNIGDAANNGNSATKTVFSGSGTITTANLDFPNANNHTLTVESGVTLGFSGGGTFYENSTGLITIDGGGTIDLANVTIVTTDGNGNESQGTNFGPELTIQNPPSPPAGETYTFTATGVESFDGSNTISVAIYSSAAKKLKYTFQRTSTGGNPQFSINNQTAETGAATFSAGETKPWSITAVNASNLTEGDGFTFTMYRPDGFPLGSVTWSKGKTTWTGAGSDDDWNTAGNWTNLSDISDLAGKDIELNPPLTNYPAISSDAGAKTLKIPGNTRVTQTAGSLSVESITATGSGFFKASGGTVLFNGTAGTWQSDVNGAESGKSSFVNVTVTAGKSLTLNSDMAVTGDFTVSSGASFSTGTNALVFAGSGTATAPQKLTAAGVTVGVVTVKSGTVLELQDNLTVGILTIESEAVLNCNGHNITITTSASGAGTIDVNGGTASATAVSISGSGSISEISVTDDTELSLSLSCTKCTVAADKTLTIKNDLSTGTLENNGTISSAGYDITCTTYNGASDGTDAMTLSGNVTLSVGPNVGSITYAGGGTFAAGSDGIKTGTLNVTGTAGNATLDGTMTLGKLVANDATLGGKTLTINGTLTVGSGVTGTAASQTLVLSGISGSPLTVDGTGTINLNKMQSGGKWLSVGSGPVISVSGGGAYTTTYSTGPASPTTVPSGWNICENGLVYVWTGSAGSSTWDAAGNWSVGMVPSGTSDDVEIPSGCSVYPVTPSAQLSINSLTVESGASVSVADGTKLRFVSYSGNGVIKLGTGNIEIRSAGTNCTIQNIEFTGTGTRDFADISKVTLVNVKVPAGKTLQLTGNLTLTGELDNAGTVNTNGNKLTLGSYTDSSASLTSLIQIAGNDALALSSGGTGGTVTNLSFTENAEFKDITGFTFKNATIAAGKELKLSGALTFTGTVTNNGSLNVDNKTFVCASYSGSGSDAVYANNGTFISGDGTVKTAQLNGSSAVINNGSGNLVFTAVNVTADSSSLTVTNSGTGTLTLSSSAFTGNATVTSGVSGSASSPAFATVSIGSGKTLTLGSNLTVSGMITNNGTISSAGKNLTCTTYTGASGGTDAMTLSGDVTLSVGTNTIGSITYVDSGTFAGEVNVAKFTATNLGGKALTINGTLRVGSGTATDTLQLSGRSESSKLTVDGSGTINLNASQAGGQYLSVSTSGPSIKDLSDGTECVYTATYSVPLGGPQTEFNGWNICSADLMYIWKGGDGSTDAEKTSWTRPKNWTVRIVPAAGCDVEIPATASYDVVVSSAVTVRSVSLGSSRQLTLGGDLSVTGAFTNSGTIDMNGKTLTFATYTDSAGSVVKIGASGTIQPTGAGGTVRKLVFTGSRYFSDIANLSVTDAEIPSSVTITQNGTLSVTGVLTNTGVIDMQNYDLTCGSYADTSGAAETGGLIKLGTGTLSPGSGGTLRNIEFAATRSFSDISGLTITKAKINAGVAVSLSGGFTVAGILDNNGTVNIGSNALQFAQYNHSENTSTDTLTIAGGSITSTGNGTGMINVNRFFLNGNATVTNNGTGALRFNTATAAADAVLTANGSGASPVFDNLVAGADASDTAKLTLASDITAGNVIINASATLDADSRGLTPAADSGSSAHGCTTFGAGYVLTVSGNFINNNTGHSVANPYPGFIAQNGRVEITGSGTSHKISGNNKFHDFVCVTPGAELIFDANKTTNVDHQIWICGTGSNLITMTTNATEGEKWTLDVIWDVAAGTSEHRKPVLKYVAPHKSISYSAKLKGCLVGCIDDAPNLRDSTNVNWFDDMPSIFMSLASVGGKQLAVMFSTEVDAVAGWDLRAAVALKTDTGSNLIDASVPVSMYSGSTDKSKTVVVYGLTRALTWDDLFGSASDRLHVEIVQSGAVLVRNSNIKYQMGVKHCASDFAINGVRMLFGYDNYIDPSTTLTAEKGTNSVRTWDQSDPVSNRLHAESDLLFQAQLDAGIPTDMKLEMIAMYASQLNTSAVGNNFKDYYGLSTRLWLPTAFLPLSTDAQTVPASQVIVQDSTSSGRLRNYSLHYSKSSSSPLFQMRDGEEVQFLFQIKNSDNTPFTFVHDYEFDNGTYTEVPGPLYAIRLKDDADITSFDLWSVALQSTTLQRGNVTILNNVINADRREQTFVTIELQKAGSLTVQVLTLDGSVITTLQRGRKQPGTYGYSWDGTNGKGRPVARGMYFIRIIGPDIDETRKVMVVRD